MVYGSYEYEELNKIAANLGLEEVRMNKYDEKIEFLLRNFYSIVQILSKGILALNKDVFMLAQKIDKIEAGWTNVP